MFVIWNSTNLTYFGIAMSATNLSSNVYIAFILSALVKTPSLINIWFMSHWGRKPTLVLSLIVAGLGCIIGGLTTGNIRMAFVLLGKCGGAAAFNTVFNYTAEIYPTVVRSTGLGLSAMAGRIGGISAPVIALYLPVITFKELPLLIFGFTSFVSAVLALLLPETLGAPLVESFDELRILHGYSKPLFSWWSSKQVEDNIKKINALRVQ